MSSRAPFLKDVGQNIRKIRLNLGLSMSELAKLVDPTSKTIGSGTVSNWEHGKNAPNSKRLKRISELGNTSVEEILGIDEFHRVILQASNSLQNQMSKTVVEKFGKLDMDALHPIQLSFLLAAIESSQYFSVDELRDLASPLSSMSQNFPPVFDSKDELMTEKSNDKKSFGNFVDKYFSEAKIKNN